MALFTVDSNNTFSSNYIQEAGTYNVKVLPSTQLVQAKTGKPMVQINYEVLDGDYAGAEQRYDNLVWDDSAPEKIELSQRRLNTFLVAGGVPDGTPVESLQYFVNNIVGMKLNITLDWEKSTYGNNAGKYFLQVKQHNKLDVDGSKPNGKKRPESQAGAGNAFNSAPQGGFNQGTAGSFNTNDLPFSNPQSTPQLNSVPY